VLNLLSYDERVTSFRIIIGGAISFNLQHNHYNRLELGINFD